MLAQRREYQTRIAQDWPQIEFLVGGNILVLCYFWAFARKASDANIANILRVSEKPT